MIDVLVTLCVLEAPGSCAPRTVPVGAPNCAAAMTAARPRLAAWRRDHRVEDLRCGAADAAPLAFEEVRPGLLVHRAPVALADPSNGGSVGNVVVVVGDEAVAVIDAGGARATGEAVVAAVRARTALPIRALILTHGHPDHVFGATALADAGVEVLGHDQLPDALAARAEGFVDQGRRQVGAGFIGSEMPLVDRTVDDMAFVDLGGRVLELRAWPMAHSGADLTVLDRATGTLIAGDLVFADHLPTLDGSLLGWLEALDTLERLRADAVVPGHGGPLLPWPDAAEPQRRYLQTLERDLRALLAAGATVGEAAGAAAVAEAAEWSLFEEHNPRNATTAYTELEWK